MTHFRPTSSRPTRRWAPLARIAISTLVAVALVGAPRAGYAQQNLG
jgi:hypothetical protein